MSYLEIARMVQARLHKGDQGRIGPLQLTSVGPDHPDFLDLASRLLRIDLANFEREGCAIEIRVPWMDSTLWLVPDEPIALLLVAERVSRSRIWTVRELQDLLTIPGLTVEKVHMIQTVKDAFAGRLAEVRKVEGGG